MLHMSNSFNIQIDYKNLGKKDNYFYSKLSLDTKPKFVSKVVDQCLVFNLKFLLYYVGVFWKR